MERGSDRHGPLLDEEMAKEVGGLTKGHAGEPHAQEDREKEPPAEGEPTPDARIIGAGAAAGGGLSLDEAEARAELARWLDPSVFPATRARLLESAARNQAPDRVLTSLAQLDRGGEEYGNIQAVWVALGGRTERRA